MGSKTFLTLGFCLFKILIYYLHEDIFLVLHICNSYFTSWANYDVWSRVVQSSVMLASWVSWRVSETGLYFLTGFLVHFNYNLNNLFQITTTIFFDGCWNVRGNPLHPGDPMVQAPVRLNKDNWYLMSWDPWGW